MILGTALLIKVFLTLACGFGIFWLLREKTAKRYTAVLLALITVAVGAFLGQKVSELIPPLTDTVTITALNERSADSSGTGVLLSGYTVDDQSYAIDSPAEGKWFWFGERLMWRSPGSASTPDGLTQTIQIAVPVGWSRTIDFAGDKWKGLASVQFGGEEQTVDLYASKSAAIPVKIGQSASGRLILNQIRYLAVYAAVILCLSGAVIFSARFYISESGNAWVKRNKAVLLIALIALAQFAFAVKYSGIDCFWYDELYEVSWSVTSENLIERAFRGTAPLPLYGLFMGIWYEIAPYGEKWMLLPMEIGTAIGIFFVGMTGKELLNKYVGIASALLAAVSSTILVQCSYETRSYAFYFCSAAVLLFLFLRHIRGRNAESWKSIIGLGFSMIFFAGMHHHAAFYCVTLCVVDFLYLVYYDRFEWRKMFRMMTPYAMAALSYIPTLIHVVTSNKMSHIDGQAHTSEIKLSTVETLFNYFSSYSDYLLYIFVFGFVVVLSIAVVEIYQRKTDTRIQILKIAAPAIWLLFTVLFFIGFGMIRQENGASTLWAGRYFIGMMPSFFVTAGAGCYYLSRIVKRWQGNDARGFVAVSILLCILILPPAMERMSVKAQTVRQPYREAADWLYSQGNYIYNENTLVIFTTGESVTAGWSEYYLTRQGERDALNVVDRSVTGEFLEDYDRIYVVYIYADLRSSLQKILDSDFELESTHDDIKIKVYVRK